MKKPTFWTIFEFGTKFDLEFLTGFTELNVFTNVPYRSTSHVYCVKVSKKLEQNCIFGEFSTLYGFEQLLHVEAHHLISYAQFWKILHCSTSAATNQLWAISMTSLEKQMELVNIEYDNESVSSIVDIPVEV